MHKATAAFSANGKQFPAGSWVIKTDQAFRSHVLDMFEPQDHPNDFRYPGGPPIPPYDNAGWTLAFQMGIDAIEQILKTLIRVMHVRQQIDHAIDTQPFTRPVFRFGQTIRTQDEIARNLKDHGFRNA